MTERGAQKNAASRAGGFGFGKISVCYRERFARSVKMVTKLPTRSAVIVSSSTVIHSLNMGDSFKSVSTPLA